MKVKLPNFLIVGAAKSGTTSLYHYLKQHPEVYMSPVKEPRFITAQFVKFPLMGLRDGRVEKDIIKNFNEYEKLFKNIRNEKAIGEASPDNLYFYEDAIKYIEKYLGDIKIIIILRNPVERAFSNYTMLRFRDLREYLSFEDALKAEDERKSKNWAFGWHYKSIGFYYKQVKAYLENFGQVKVYLYDDLKSDALGLIKNMYTFLEINPSFVPDVSFKYNTSGVPKNKIFHNMLTKPNIFKNAVKKICKFFLIEQKINHYLKTLKTKNLEKIQMEPKMQQYLKDLYREDIMKLQDLINRDLSHWLEIKR